MAGLTEALEQLFDNLCSSISIFPCFADGVAMDSAPHDYTLRRIVIVTGLIVLLTFSTH